MMIKFPQLNNFLTCPALLKLEGRVTKHTNLIARWNLHQCIDKLNINLLKLKKDAFQKEILKREALWGKKTRLRLSKREPNYSQKSTKLWVANKEYFLEIMNFGSKETSYSKHSK